MKVLVTWLGWGAALGVLAVSVGAVQAQDAPTVPAVTLPELEGEPAPAAEPEGPPILERAGWSQRNRRDPDEDAEPLPDDVAFVVPGDMRSRSAEQNQLALPGADPGATEPPPFMVALGAGFSRQLTEEPLHYFRLQQRFEARVPGLDMLRLGLGAAEMIGDRFLFEAGGRVGLAAAFCSEPDVFCEGTVTVQPGVATGDFGTFFAFNAGLDIRVVVARTVLISADASLSFIGGSLFVNAVLNGGLTF